MLTQRQFLNAARSFDADEIKTMRDAYGCASDAFSITHHTTAALETKLASIILFLFTSVKLAHPGRAVDVRELAEEGLETLVRFSNATQRAFC